MITDDVGITIAAQRLGDTGVLVEIGHDSFSGRMVEVRADYINLMSGPESVRVNWSSVGSVNPTGATLFGVMLHAALSIAKQLDQQDETKRRVARDLCMALYGDRP